MHTHSTQRSYPAFLFYYSRARAYTQTTIVLVSMYVCMYQHSWEDEQTIAKVAADCLILQSYVEHEIVYVLYASGSALHYTAHNNSRTASSFFLQGLGFGLFARIGETMVKAIGAKKGVLQRLHR